MLKKIAVIFVSLFILPNISSSEETFSVSGEISIIDKGDIHVGIYSPEDWSNRKDKTPSPPYFQIINLNPEQIKMEKVPFEFQDIKRGTYCIHVYQDVNQNGKLDKKPMGTPAEPLGEYRSPLTWSSWNDMKFEVDKDIADIEIQMYEPSW
jgi:uncharacterized protein (DUF2141 family)